MEFGKIISVTWLLYGDIVGDALAIEGVGINFLSCSQKNMAKNWL